MVIFMVNDGTSQFYTRAGNFYLDEEGAIVNSEGLYVGRRWEIKLSLILRHKALVLVLNGTINIVASRWKH